jgi:hypothetical protein
VVSIFPTFLLKMDVGLIAKTGNIIRQAEQIGVKVPTVRMVYHLLLEINQRIRDAVEPTYAAQECIFEYGGRRMQALAISN